MNGGQIDAVDDEFKRLNAIIMRLQAALLDVRGALVREDLGGIHSLYNNNKSLLQIIDYAMRVGKPRKGNG